MSFIDDVELVCYANFKVSGLMLVKKNSTGKEVSGMKAVINEVWEVKTSEESCMLQDHPHMLCVSTTHNASLSTHVEK